MLNSIFLIFLFQLIGELVQKVLELNIPGPVIGLILLLTTLLLSKKYDHKLIQNLKVNLISSAEKLVHYIPLFFLPVGVGVVMHLSFLEGSLVKVLFIIVFGTLITLALTGLLMEKLLKNKDLK
ncbi:MAG: CidA/LrgA family protein [Candidatus Puniceispirillales bacterium]|jgi:holin-like protein|tara:strand:+ start:932 stop:1303 length:372 start_codon:yes stop_codon:yes gene_type:complete